MDSQAAAGHRLAMRGGSAEEAAPGGGRPEILDLVAGEAAHGGWCVARDGRGRVVFVRHALPGERIRARVTGATAKFARADAVEIREPSPDRVEPSCPHARPGGCGGCDWQHASLPAQRRLKGEVVRHQLRRIAGVDVDVNVEPMPGEAGGLGWRTRVRFSAGADGTVGLLAHRSHDVIAVGGCPIAHPLVDVAAVTRQRWPDAESVEVVVSPASGERTVIARGRRGRRREVAVSGRDRLQYRAAGRSWRVSAGVFWQVHPEAADVLAGAVLAALRPQAGDTVLDLYCGAGLFAGVVARAVGPGGTVIGIESDPASVRDARRNLRNTPWARVHRGDVAALLTLPGSAGAGQAVLDPPRAGAGRRVIGPLLRALAGSEAAGLDRSRVAYVSCDPATLARDIAIFAENGWTLRALRAFDAFPMTHHVECLAVLAPG